jgi:hypothetical protein
MYFILKNSKKIHWTIIKENKRVEDVECGGFFIVVDA